MAGSLNATYELAVLEGLVAKNNDFGRVEAGGITYVGLFTAVPNRTGGGTEASYAGYFRIKTAASSWTGVAGTSSEAAYIYNNEALVGALVNSGEVVIKAVELCSGASGENQIAWFELGSELHVPTPKAPIFEIEALKLSLS